jgi:2-(1,2-epoxy-1,2-dihydrophenyl)acetyl-CoA isomerase
MVREADPAELVRTLYRALAAGDREALDAVLDPDFVGEATLGLPLGLGGRYVGARAMRREFWGVIAKNYDLAAHPQEVTLLSDGRVLVTGVYLGSARSSGRKLEAAFTHTITVAGGRITALHQLTDSARWIDALAPLTVPMSPADRPALRCLSLDLSGPIGRMTLRRPDAGNAIDAVLAADLLTAAQLCTAADNLRVLIFDAEGPAFCPGGDLAALSAVEPAELPGLLDQMLTEYHQALRLFIALPIPIVAAVHGSAGGGGLGLVHVADIVVCGANAKFAVGSGKLALGSDGGNTWFLPQLVGRRVAAQMCYDNRVLAADEALAHGLVSEVLPTEAVPARASEIAARLAGNSRRSNAKLRELLRPGRRVSDALDAERNGMVSLAESPDVIEAMRAFLERRPARFSDE